MANAIHPFNVLYEQRISAFDACNAWWFAQCQLELISFDVFLFFFFHICW